MSNEKIVLGSGKLYVLEFQNGTIPDKTILEVEENILGLIQGGATIEYKPEFYTAEDDFGIVKKTITTKEEVLFKSGLMTWNGETLSKLCATAKFTDDNINGIRTVKIGGIGNSNNKQYILRFVHTDKKDGDIRITIIGSNQSGFTLAFTKDKESVIDAEFMALPQDKDGTLILFEEEIPKTITKKGSV